MNISSDASFSTNSVFPPASVNVPISEFADVSTDTNLAVVPELCNLTTVDEPKLEPFVVDVPHAFSCS